MPQVSTCKLIKQDNMDSALQFLDILEILGTLSSLSIINGIFQIRLPMSACTFKVMISLRLSPQTYFNLW